MRDSCVSPKNRKNLQPGGLYIRSLQFIVTSHPVKGVRRFHSNSSHGNFSRNVVDFGAYLQDNKEDESLEPPKKRVKALAGIPESGDLSSDEEDLLLPVEAQEDAEEEDEDAEVMVPKGSKHSSKVDCLGSCFWALASMHALFAETASVSPTLR